MVMKGIMRKMELNSEACLVICHGNKQNPLLTLYNASQRTHHTRVSPQLANKRVCASYEDWLLVQDVENNRDYCIMNVVTMRKIQLPPMLKEKYYFDTRPSSFLLSHSPHLAEAAPTVYLFCLGTVLYCKLGADQFAKQKLQTESLTTVTMFQGSVYYLTCFNALYCAEARLQEEELRFRECIEGEKLWEVLRFWSPFYCALVGSGDQLLHIQGRCLEMGAVEFQVLRADLSGKIWEKVYNIGSDRAIFVDEMGAFSAPVLPGCGVKGNSICYMPLQDDVYDEDASNNLTLFAYELKDQRVTVLPPFPFKIEPTTRPTLPQLRWMCNHSSD